MIWNTMCYKKQILPEGFSLWDCIEPNAQVPPDLLDQGAEQ